MAGAAELLWDSPSVQARFEDTGTVSQKTALALGLVGPAARACGVDRDVRRDFPDRDLPVRATSRSRTWHTGDVFARAYVRWLEIQRSGQFVLRTAPVASRPGPIRDAGRRRWCPRRWSSRWSKAGAARSATSRSPTPLGQFAHYKIVDPSFHNWIGLAMALRNQQISDFPLCNKSFNLSYCGHDL